MSADREAAIRDLEPYLENAGLFPSDDLYFLANVRRVLAELSAACEREGNLTLELEAERHNHRKDNEHLLAEVEKLRAEIEEYLLWEPGRRGHGAAHARLRAALSEGEG